MLLITENCSFRVEGSSRDSSRPQPCPMFRFRPPLHLTPSVSDGTESTGFLPLLEIRENWKVFFQSGNLVITARVRTYDGRLCFHRCVSVQGGGYPVSVKGKFFDTRFGLIHVQAGKKIFVEGTPPPPPPPQ